MYKILVGNPDQNTEILKRVKVSLS